MNNFLATIFTFLCLLSFTQIAFGEENFREKVNQAKNDTSKVVLLLEWDDKIYLQNADLDLKLNSEIIEICRRNLKSKKLTKKEFVFFNENLARSLNNKGLNLIEKNRLNEALLLLTECYKIAKKHKVKLTESHAANNIGTIYRALKEYKKAIEYYQISFNIFKDSAMEPATFNNIALCYADIGETQKALKYYALSLKFTNHPDHWLNKANTELNIADIYLDAKQLDSAKKYFEAGLKTNLDLKNHRGISYAYCEIAKVNRMKKEYALALKNAHAGFQIAKQYNFLYNLQESSKVLYKIHKTINKLDSALFYYEQFNIYFDQYTKQTNKEELIRKKYFYEYQNKEELVATKHKKQLEVEEEKIKRQKIILIFIFLLFVGFLVFVFFVIKSYRRTKKMNSLIETQKMEVELKNKEILDSITYAKRIQSAILPTDDFFQSKFQDSFILYLPKDIVAGDFYWLDEQDDKILFAVADCTGHGVPGAMVSVVCHNALNRCIREFKLVEPNKILDKTREIIISEFQKSNEDVKDGMDISLACLDKKTNQLTWAGANNPLVVIRNKQLIEFKPDKQPIGNYAFTKDFSLQSFQLQKGDVLYLFSDGYSDQFGGNLRSNESGKKFKYKQLKNLFLDMHEGSMADQKMVLKNEFFAWKQHLEQVDDICIVGIRV